MNWKIFSLLLVFGAALFATQSAEARRGIRVPIFLGGGSGSGSVVKVRDLPDIPALKRKDGRYVDLGYHFKGSGGEWVGYIGSSRRYVPFKNNMLAMVMTVSGLGKLPPVPVRTSSGGNSIYFIVLAVIAFLVIGKFVLGLFRRRGSPDSTARAAREYDAPASNEAEHDGNYSHAIERALRQKKEAVTPSPSASPAPATPSFQPAHVAPRATFGKR